MDVVAHPSETTDREFLAALRAGRTQPAFSELCGRYTNFVYAACLRILNDSHDAEDATQATFLILFNKARRLPADVFLKGWLHQTAVHASLDRRRKYAIQRKHERHIERAAASRGLAADPWAEIQPQLDEAIQMLPARLRDAVLVRHVGGKSEQETARELGCSLSAASMRVSRGLDQMRDFFRKRGYAVPAVALASMLDASDGVATPAGLAETAAAVGSGTSAASGPVLEIARGVQPSVLWLKVKVAAVAVAASAVVTTGAYHAVTAWGPPPAAAGLSVPAGVHHAGVIDIDVTAPEAKALREYLQARYAVPRRERPESRATRLRLHLQLRGGRVVAAHHYFLEKAAGGTWISIPVDVRSGPEEGWDWSGLRLEGDRLRGRVVLAPFDGKQPAAALAIDARVVEGRIAGTIDGAPIADGAGKEAGAAKAHAFAAGKDWPHYAGPNRTLSVSDPANVLVDDLREARLAWISEERTGAARYGEAHVRQHDGRTVILGGQSAPILAEGKIFFNTYAGRGRPVPEDKLRLWHDYPVIQFAEGDDVVVCMDAASGKTLWKQIFPGGVWPMHFKHENTNNTGCYWRGRVYLMGWTFRLYCLEAMTGRLVWQQTIGPQHEEMERRRVEARRTGVPAMAYPRYPILDAADGVVFTGGNRFDGGTVAFDAETGQLLWGHRGTHARAWRYEGRDRIVCLAGAARAGRMRDDLVCLEPRTGREVWRVPGVTAGCGTTPFIPLLGDFVVQTFGQPGISGPNGREGDDRLVGCRIDGSWAATKLWELGRAELTPLVDFPIAAIYPKAIHDGVLIVGVDNVSVGHASDAVAVDAASGNVLGRGHFHHGEAGRPARYGAASMYGPCLAVNDRLLLEPAPSSETWMAMRALRTMLPLGEPWDPPHPQSNGHDELIPPLYADGRLILRGLDRIYCWDLRKRVE